MAKYRCFAQTSFSRPAEVLESSHQGMTAGMLWAVESSIPIHVPFFFSPNHLGSVWFESFRLTTKLWQRTPPHFNKCSFSIFDGGVRVSYNAAGFPSTVAKLDLLKAMTMHGSNWTSSCCRHVKTSLWIHVVEAHVPSCLCTAQATTPSPRKSDEMPPKLRTLPCQMKKISACANHCEDLFMSIFDLLAYHL